MKRNETNLNEMKRIEKKWNEMKRIETNWNENETKWKEFKRNETNCDPFVDFVVHSFCVPSDFPPHDLFITRRVIL